MLRGYRLAFCALVGLTLAAGAQTQTAHNGGQHSANAAQTAPKPQDEAQPIIPALAQTDIQRIARALERANTYQESKPQQTYQTKYLKSQRHMAKWAGRMFVAALWESFITLIGVGLVGWTLAATRRAATAAEGSLRVLTDNGQRDLRPYVSLSIDARRWPNAPVIGTTGQQAYVWNRYSIVLTIKNTGKTWAQTVRVQKEFRRNPTGDAWQAIGWNVEGENSVVLAPGEEISLQFGDIPRTELGAIAAGQILVFFAAWLTYDDPLTEPAAQRQTRLYRRLNADAEENVSFTWMPTNNCADDSCQ